MPDDERTPAEPSPPKDSPPPAIPYLDYTSQPPRPPKDDPVADFLHFVTGFVVYTSLLVTMKVLAVRYRWPIDAICGTWIVLIFLSFGVAAWLAGSLHWRGVMAGVLTGLIVSLLLSAMILKE